MKTLKLKRLKSNSMGTLGILTIDGNEICQTLELAWNNNAKNSSCIPDGVYFCERINSPKFGNTFEIKNVKDRDDILFHAGNFLKNTHGCVLVGLQSGEANGEYCIYKSKAAFEVLMKILENEDKICLEIF